MGPDIETLIQKISRLPGLGQRSARRIVVHMIKNKNKENIFDPIMACMKKVSDNVKICPLCFNVDTFTGNSCSICSDDSRKKDLICIVETITDLWAIERTFCFKGQYHVLDGLLSSLENRGPEVLRLEELNERCEKQNVSEIVIALSATVEGQTTNHYIRNFFKDKHNIKITSLAHGIPIGGELDYLDDATLFTAFSARG
ncbi:MAG: recombination protein RecR [Alphaproteobacteria bacterium]|nr:recombination protein RecR [Alphaproteobacteria bacterium]